MPHLERRHGRALNLNPRSLLIFNELDVEWTLGRCHAGIERLRRGNEAGLDAGRSSDGQRAPTLADEKRVYQEPRQSAEMIAVEVANEDSIDRARIEPDLAHTDQGRGAAID